VTGDRKKKQGSRGAEDKYDLFLPFLNYQLPITNYLKEILRNIKKW
jgi:hypothetical protein